jgi:NTE family protein
MTCGAVYDDFDQPGVPSRGTRIVAEGRWLHVPGVNGSLAQAELRTTTFVPLSRLDSMFVLASGGTTRGGGAPLAAQFTLGGPFRLSGCAAYELRGSHYVLSGVGWLHRASEGIGPLASRMYIGGWYECGAAFERFGAGDLRHSISVGVLAETILGVVSVTGTLDNRGHRQLLLSTGRGF